jgi:hypothetical protein
MRKSALRAAANQRSLMTDAVDNLVNKLFVDRERAQ